MCSQALADELADAERDASVTPLQGYDDGIA